MPLFYAAEEMEIGTVQRSCPEGRFADPVAVDRGRSFVVNGRIQYEETVVALPIPGDRNIMTGHQSHSRTAIFEMLL